MTLRLLLACHLAFAGGQAVSPPANTAIVLTVVDENGLPVPSAQVTIDERAPAPVLQTDYLGRCVYSLRGPAPYEIAIDKPGFYQTAATQVETASRGLRLVLAHQQIIRESVNVVASVPGIDAQDTSGVSTMNTPEIVNIPYPVNRDVRNLLPFNTGVVQDNSGQAHVAGSKTYETLDLLDGFDIRSPASGNLSLRVRRMPCARSR